MSRDLTIEDLANDDAESSNQSNGEWINSLVEKLDEKGLLEALIFGPENSQIDPQEAEPTQTDNSDMTDMDAEGIKNLLLQVYDNAGQIPGMSEDPTLSELIKLVDSNPDMVDKMIEQYL